MNLLYQFVGSPFTEKLGWCLLHSLWQVALVGIVLKVALDLIGHRSARARYNLAFVALLCCMLAPVITWSVLATPERPVSVAKAAPPVLSEPPPVETDRAPVVFEEETAKTWPDTGSTVENAPTAFGNITVVPTTPEASSVAKNRSQFSWLSWVTCVWLTGILISSFRPLIGVISARKLLRTDRGPVPERVVQSIVRLSRQLGIRQMVEIAESGLINVPTLVGIVRPTILLPVSSLTNLSTDELDAILLHELAHVRRLDPFANLVQTVIETLLFYHPVVWWMSGVIRHEREDCCDDLAVSSCGESRSLVRALVALEEKRETGYGQIVLSSRGGSLVHRVKRLVDPASRPGRSVASLYSTVAVLMTALSLTVTFATKSESGTRDLVQVDELQSLKVSSVSELYAWDSKTTTNSRLIHRFWNIFTPEKREQQGEVIEGWTPDLEFEFTADHGDGAKPGVVTVQVGLQDGFRWSVGKGIWLMDGQWPMRYSLAELIRESNDNIKPDRETSLMREKMFNETAWHRETDALAKEHTGKWVAIVDGRVLAPFDSFDDCVAAADKANPHAVHRYIFRPGIDDQPEEFAYSPWMTGSANWWQIGIQFRREHKFTVATDRWISGGKTLHTDAKGKGAIQLSSVEDSETRINRAAVCSGMVTQFLTITEEDVDRLNLERFAVPGIARSKTYKKDFRKVLVQLSLEALDIQQTVVAFVAPKSLVDQDRLVKPDLLQEKELQNLWDALEVPSKQPATDEDELPDSDVELLNRMEKAMEELNKIQSMKDTVIVTKVDENGLNLHQIKVRNLDKRLSQLRERQAIIQSEQEYILKELEKGTSLKDVADWIRNQGSEIGRGVLFERIKMLKEQKTQLEKTYGPKHPDMLSLDRQIKLWESYAMENGFRNPEAIDPDFSDEEVVQRHKVELDRYAKHFEARIATVSEEFKFHFEKAKLIERLMEQEKQLNEYIDLIKSRLNPVQTEVTEQEESAPEKDQASTETDELTWTVTGTVKTESGDPLKGVNVWASTGMGSLRRSGEAVTDEHGKYSLTFFPGFWQYTPNDFTRSKAPVQAASIFASLPGYTEVNLCRQGDRLMADEVPAEDTAWGSVEDVKKKLIVKGKPQTIDFVMKPAARIEGYVVDQNNNLMQRYSLSLTGPELPPSSNVYSQIYTDLNGKFVFEEVPVGKKWQFDLALARLHADLFSGEFELTEASTTKWLLKYSQRGEGPSLSVEPLSDEMEEMISAKIRESEASRNVRGTRPAEEQAESENLQWGDPSEGLQAALDLRNATSAENGGFLDLHLVIRNVGDAAVRFESPEWRQGDKMRIYSTGDGAKKQNVENAEYSGNTSRKIYVLQPGEQVAIRCGKLAVTRPGKLPTLPTVSGTGDDWDHALIPYRSQLAAGSYTVSLRARIPTTFVETGLWQGSLTTGEVGFEMN